MVQKWGRAKPKLNKGLRACVPGEIGKNPFFMLLIFTWSLSLVTWHQRLSESSLQYGLLHLLRHLRVKQPHFSIVDFIQLSPVGVAFKRVYTCTIMRTTLREAIPHNCKANSTKTNCLLLAHETFDFFFIWRRGLTFTTQYIYAVKNYRNKCIFGVCHFVVVRYITVKTSQWKAWE